MYASRTASDVALLIIIMIISQNKPADSAIDIAVRNHTVTSKHFSAHYTPTLAHLRDSPQAGCSYAELRTLPIVGTGKRVAVRCASQQPPIPTLAHS